MPSPRVITTSPTSARAWPAIRTAQTNASLDSAFIIFSLPVLFSRFDDSARALLLVVSVQSALRPRTSLITFSAARIASAAIGTPA